MPTPTVSVQCSPRAAHCTSVLPSGTLALSANPEKSYIAFANSTVAGEAAIYDVRRQAAVNIVKAHVGPLVSLAVSNAGSMLATASDTGTVVRVFALPSCERLHTFRRGSSPVRVSCLSFVGLGHSVDDLLLCGSTSDTLHGFGLSAPYVQRLAEKRLLDYSVSASQSSSRSEQAPQAAATAGGGFFGTVRTPLAATCTKCAYVNTCRLAS